MTEIEELYEIVANLKALSWAALETEDEDDRLCFISLITEQAQGLKAKLHEMENDGAFVEDDGEEEF